MSRKNLPVVGLFHKSELLLLCCLIIKGIKFCLWLLFIISKGNIVPRCLTLRARRSLMFSCNTNTQNVHADAGMHVCTHPFLLHPALSRLFSFACAQTHRSLFLTVSSCCCLIYSVTSDPSWAELDGLSALLQRQLVRLQCDPAGPVRMCVCVCVCL